MRGSRMKALGDLDDLALRERERTRSARGSIPFTPKRSRHLGRERDELASLDQAARAAGLASHEQVLGDRQPREQGELLEDRADAEAAGRGCGRVVTSSPSKRTTPDSGLMTPPMILISVLLPAPFSPTSACTSPKLAERCPAVRASTPPNERETSIASIAGLAAVVLSV